MQRSKKEGIILGLVALVGVAGLLVLQVLRKSDNTATGDRSLVQTSTQADAPRTQEVAQSKIQKIPKDLLRFSDTPECDRAFVFELGEFQPGAVYTLDPGDGSPVKPFLNGKLPHTYHKSGSFHITLFASYQGETEQLQIVTQVAAKQLQQKTLNKKTGKPVLDF